VSVLCPVLANAEPKLRFLWKSCELGSLTALQQNRYVKKVSRTAEFTYVGSAGLKRAAQAVRDSVFDNLVERASREMNCSS